MKNVILRVIFHTTICERKQKWDRELRRGHSGHFPRWKLRQAKSKDSVYSLEVRAVANRDASKFCERKIITKLNHIICFITLESRIVCILQEKLPMLDILD